MHRVLKKVLELTLKTECLSLCILNCLVIQKKANQLLGIYIVFNSLHILLIGFLRSLGAFNLKCLEYYRMNKLRRSKVTKVSSKVNREWLTIIEICLIDIWCVTVTISKSTSKCIVGITMWCLTKAECNIRHTRCKHLLASSIICNMNMNEFRKTLLVNNWCRHLTLSRLKLNLICSVFQWLCHILKNSSVCFKNIVLLNNCSRKTSISLKVAC